MMARPRIVVAEPDRFSGAAEQILRRLGEVRLEAVDRAGLLEAVDDADVLWVRLAHRIDRAVFEAAKRLKVVVTPTTGLNHIDLDVARSVGVEVLSLRGEQDFLKEVRATAELTIAMMLALMRRVPAASRHVLEGGWDRDLFRGNELCGKVAGVLGYGRLGRMVANLLVAFRCRVLVHDPSLPETALPPGVEFVSRTALLAESELVTLHVNLTEENEGFFNAALFDVLRRGAWFVNTSRGELVDEAALLDALRSGRLSGAAVDVLRDEHAIPIRGNLLIEHAREHANLLITPHLGGCTFESMEKTELFMARKLEEWLSRWAG